MNKWHLHIIEKYDDISVIENKDNYEVLLPNTEADKNKHYANPFTVALKTPKVNNIAITGAYGSGKSSFLRTFEKENAEYNYLPISLASFKDTPADIEKKEEPKEENPPSSTDTKEVTEENKGKDKSELLQDIERSILQQFFYREKDSKIPYSRFKRIRNIQKKIIFYHSFVVGFLFLYGFSIFKTSKFIELFSSNFFANHKYNYLSYISVGILLYYLYRLFTYLWNIQISKFNFKKGEVSLAKQDKSSILNEHLDEILYFFEVTEYDVVIFEDIDRFDNTEIFIKLRELNNLINNSKQIDRRVRFVYAIRDDMFIDKERTKFFDFIVPVIPYIDPSNSEMELIKRFEQEIKDKKIDENFISQVSLYIDDMRLLINIHNEYMIYKNNLNSDKLNHNKILALVICKNFYPLDFANLYVRDGVIYDLFLNKPKYINTQIENFYQQKINKENQLELIENENTSSLNELRMIYIYTLFTNSSYTSSTASINGQHRSWSLSELLNEENFEYIVANDTSFRFTNNYNSYQFSTIEKEVNREKTYLERKSFIEDKYNNKINNLKKEIEDFNKKITQLKQATLKELFKTSSHIIIEGYEDKNLLIFLVRNGYIDEYYEHYISYFHKGGITQEDREFLLSIQNYNALNFTFKLGNMRKLLEKLKEKDFKQVEILNFNLTDFLLNNSNEYSDKAETFFKQISDESELAVNFIFAYLEYTANSLKKEFIKKLQWNNLWLHIYNNFSTDKQNEYFSLIFQALDADKIIAFNVDDSLKKYLEKQMILPKYSDTKNKKCQELISELELDFSDIENPSDNEELFNYIYENWNYELSERMIKIMLSEKADISMDDLAQAHFTTIRGSRAKELIEYIDTNIEEYVENIFLVIENNLKESEETVCYLLNSDEVNFENKVKIIQKEEVRISDINLIDNTNILTELFKNNKVEATWDNILYYYRETEELSEEIIDYLNIEDNYIQLSEHKINNKTDFDKDTILADFNRKLIISEKISNEAYVYILNSIWFITYQSLAIEQLNSVKIDALLKTKIFALSQSNINKLDEYFNPRQITLIEKYKEEFLEKFDEFEIDADNISKLMSSEKFTTEEKLDIIEKIDLDIFDEFKTLKEQVSKLYLDINKEIENVDIFNKLFYGENKYDLELLILQIPYLNDCDTCKVYLDEFEEEYTKLFENIQGFVALENTSLNQSLLKVLKEKNCIGKYLLKKKKINAYRKWTSLK